MKRYKFLHLERNKIVSESGYTAWKIGEWQKCSDELAMCSVGFHCSKKVYQAFSYIQGSVLAEVEVRSKSIKQYDKEVWSEMRITKAYKWQKKDSMSLAIYAAELVLKNYEKEYSKDKRPREAIEAARKVLEKDTAKSRSAAWSAWSAAWSAWSAAESARSAARSARSAARSARSATESARSAAESAWFAARAARSAAESAAESARFAARAALIKKIDKFMTDRIKQLEEIK